MTSPASAPSRHESRGFTLTEIVVVMGILIILAGLLLPMGMRAYRNAGRARDAADLQAIAVALDAYRADMGDYPRLPPGEFNTGAGVLGKALYGPAEDSAASTLGNTIVAKTYNAADAPFLYGTIVHDGTNFFMSIKAGDGATTAPPSADWAMFDPVDNAQGLGFRMRMTAGGKSWGPYLQEGKFELRGTTIRDRHQNPILYFPGNPSKPNIRQAPAVGDPAPYVDQVDATAGTMYNANHNINAFVRVGDADAEPALTRIRLVLGDCRPNGYIDSTLASETEATTADYILWTAGADEEFGPTDVKLLANVTTVQDFNDNRDAAAACDDVTNFR